MDFKDELLILAERVGKLKDNVKTEEATKTSHLSSRSCKHSATIFSIRKRLHPNVFATMERRKAKKSTIPYVWTASRSC